MRVFLISNPDDDTGACGVDMIGEMEADSDSARAGPGRIIIGNRGDARRIRVADGHWSGRPVYVWGPRQPRRLGRRTERTDAHQPLGVGRPKAGVYSPGYFVEDAEQV